MNKASLLLAISLFATACTPKLAQNTDSSGRVTQETLRKDGNHEGPCIFDGRCTEEVITIFGRPYTLIATDKKEIPGHEPQKTEKQ